VNFTQPTNTTCLTPAEIDLLLADRLPTPRLLLAENHLSHCSVCQQALQTAAGGGEFQSEVTAAIHADPHPNPLASTSPQITASALLPLLGPTDNPHMLGRIGPWEIAGLVGIGGMGAVFKAFDPSLNRFVAVKILLPHLAAAPSARTRFSREAQAAAAVVNEHVLPIHAVDEYRGIPYLVMQYVRGGTLQQRISDRGPLTLPEILRIALHIARGLAAAHEIGIIHRDVKPSNVLLDDSGQRAWLTDFGLARAADDASVTRSGQLAGTPEFMSPEQIQGAPPDPRSDLFSLGCVLWTMAAGFPPFRADTPWTVLRRIVDQPTPELPRLQTPPPPWFTTLLQLLMAKQPDNRPRSATAVAELLQQCLRHLEHPRINPLPPALESPQNLFSSPRKRNLLMTSLSLAAAMFFASLAPTATGPTSPEPAATQPAANATLTATPDGMTGSTIAGGHRIEIVGSANVKNMESVAIFRRDLAFPMSVDSNFQQFGDSANFNVPGGNFGGGGGGGGGGIAAAGGGGGGGGGNAGGPDGELISPNFGIALKITPEKANSKRKVRVTVDLEPGASVVEQDGQTVTSPAGSVQVSYPEFEQQFPDCRYLYVERRQNPNRVLKEISGQLKIQQGRELKAVFPSAKPGKQRVDGEEFQLQKVEQNADGLRITAAFPPTTLARKARTMQEQLQAMMQASFAMRASIEDSNGQFHEAKSGGSSGGSSGGMSSFSFNGIPQGRKNFQPPVQPNVMTFQFAPLQGRTVKNVILRMADLEGEPQLVPFTIAVEAAPAQP
jgi:serine/threonine protein kinase